MVAVNANERLLGEGPEHLSHAADVADPAGASGAHQGELSFRLEIVDLREIDDADAVRSQMDEQPAGGWGHGRVCTTMCGLQP